MTITHLLTRNTKGSSFDLTLAPLTLITGPNFSGKTTVLDSIRLALMGKLPQTATNKGIFEMASGLKMSVALKLSTGENIEREYWRDGDSILSAGVKTSEYTSPLLDAGEYFTLSPADRMAYVAARVDVGASGDAHVILDELHAKLVEGGVSTTQTLNILTEIKAVIDEQGVSAALNLLLEKTRKPSTFNLADRYTYWNGRVKDTVGAVRTLSELKNRGEECSAETLDSIGKEIADLEGQLAEANRAQGQLLEATQAANRQAVRRGQLEKLLATPREDLAAKIETMKREWASLREKRDGLDLTGKTSAELAVEIADIQRRADRAGSDARRIESDIEANRVKREELAHLAACPYCKSKSKKWKGTVEAELDTEKANLESLLKESVASFDEATNQGLAARKAQKERSIKENQAAALDEAIRELHRAIERLTAQAAGEERTLKAAREELDAMQSATVDQSAVDAAVSNVSALKASLASATERRDAAVALQQDIKRATEAQEEHEAAKANLEAVKIAGAFLKDEQQKGINTAIRSLLDGANFFTAGIMVAPLALHENEIGYFLPTGQFVSHRTFSGLEEIVTYLAISCALSAKAKLKVALLDELGTLSEGMRARVLDRVAVAVKQGMLDQAVAVLPTDKGQRVTSDRWTQIDLAK